MESPIQTRQHTTYLMDIPLEIPNDEIPRQSAPDTPRDYKVFPKKPPTTSYTHTTASQPTIKKRSR